MRNPFQKKDTVERNIRVIRRSSSGQYLAFVCSFFLACLVFFTSGWWMPVLLIQSTFPATEIGSSQSISATGKLTLRYWNYAADQRRMEVCFDTNTGDDITTSLTVSATFRKSETGGETPAELIGCWEQKLFVVLEDVPRSFDMITLSVENQSELTDAVTVRFSCNGSVDTVDTIARSSVADFRVYAIDLTLEDIKSQDRQYIDEVTSIRQKYQALNDEAAELEAQKLYQTTSEQRATQARQTAIQNEQNTLLQNIASIVNKRQELQEKSEVLIKKRAAILAGEF